MESPIKRVQCSPRKGITELSPRRTPRSPKVPNTPPQWKRPNDVMKLLRLKRNSSFNDKINLAPPKISAVKECNVAYETSSKRKNPFRIEDSGDSLKRQKLIVENENASSNLFRLLGLADPQALHSEPLNFETIIEKIREQSAPKVKLKRESHFEVPLDWALRNKLRFMTIKPFPWNQTLKTSEEASGITGFVRCIDRVNSLTTSLNLSENARFHECCLYWQFPNFPWLSLDSRRQSSKRSESSKQLPSFGSNAAIKDALHIDFTDSLRSVYQLLRVRLCPYFYVITNTFYCLFSAAGVNGSAEITALVTPTMQGFRQMMRNNDIKFEMPLRSKDRGRKSGEGIEEEGNPMEGVDEEDHGETKEWLASLGVADNDISKLNTSQTENLSATLGEMDGTDESLVYVEGCEVAGLINMLINHRSLSASTGPLAGVPPTILSPVAFMRASLSCLQVQENVVYADGEQVYSMEMRGPVLPHTIHNLCNLLKDFLDEFTLTCATETSTRAFSASSINKLNANLINRPEDSNLGSAFDVENLSDCGLKKEVLSKLCSRSVQQFDCLKFSDNCFTIG